MKIDLKDHKRLADFLDGLQPNQKSLEFCAAIIASSANGNSEDLCTAMTALSLRYATMVNSERNTDDSVKLVDRYDIGVTSGHKYQRAGELEVNKSESGDWVKYEDVKAMLELAHSHKEA